MGCTSTAPMPPGTLHSGIGQARFSIAGLHSFLTKESPVSLLDAKREKTGGKGENRGETGGNGEKRENRQN